MLNENVEEGQIGRPRTQRACDQCRQRKAKCDGHEMADRRCTSCVMTQRQCTYTNFKRQNLRPSRHITAGYVKELEDRIEQMKEHLAAVKNDTNASSEDGSQMGDATPPPPENIFVTVLRNMDQTLDPSTWADDDEDVYVPVQGAGKAGVPFGMSSSAHLATRLVMLKNENNKNLQTAMPTVEALEPEIWVPPILTNAKPNVDFPTYDILSHLVQVYFERVNIFWPFIHQPTVMRQLAEGTYLTASIIGAKLLLIIAIGSQYSPNYKLYWDIKNPHESQSWKWFSMAQQLRRQMTISLPSLTLEELQFDCLVTFFLSSFHLGHSGWVHCGVGLRMIQCAGAHKRSKYLHTPPLESELSKRVVWVLINADIIWSAAHGRTPMRVLTDLGQLVECDDEFCFEGRVAQETFKQPSGRPSKLAYFNRMISLTQILEVVLNTIYSARYLKAYLSVKVDQNLVRELDSAMNKWMDGMPHHLRWDPDMVDDVFFSQSALLHCIFYLVQILIHQPFIAVNEKVSPSTTPFPSLSICLNAARACCRIAEAHMNRTGISAPFIQFAVFTSALIILTSAYRKKGSETGVNVDREMADVKRCLAVLEGSRERWMLSYKMSQALRELASMTPDSDQPRPSQPTDDTVSSQFMGVLDVNNILSQSWGNLTGQWNMFPGPDPLAVPPDGSDFYASLPQTAMEWDLPYDFLWQNSGLRPPQ